jgi:hypothetical protein
MLLVAWSLAADWIQPEAPPNPGANHSLGIRSRQRARGNPWFAFSDKFVELKMHDAMVPTRRRKSIGAFAVPLVCEICEPLRITVKTRVSQLKICVVAEREQL